MENFSGPALSADTAQGVWIFDTHYHMTETHVLRVSQCIGCKLHVRYSYLLSTSLCKNCGFTLNSRPLCCTCVALNFSLSPPLLCVKIAGLPSTLALFATLNFSLNSRLLCVKIVGLPSTLSHRFPMSGKY
jgi:hypothetical protein